MIAVSPFEVKDIDKLYALFQDWDKEYVFDYEIFSDSITKIDPTLTKIFVAKENDEIIGYVQMTRCVNVGFHEYYEVVQLLVAENRRGHGVGKELMKKVEHVASAASVGIIKLSSRIERSRAHVFYESLGYEQVKVSKFYQKKIQ